ncbi:protein LemA [Abditibacteriota bacterium]|nr:protein LemA [Abditibacteriota bacterium]
MGRVNSALITILFILVVFAAILGGIYNGLVSRQNSVDNTFASLDANLQKRFDLVPNLVATVQGYATHERSVLEEITRLRAQAQNGGTPGARLQADAQMAPLFGQIMAVAEAYPQLHASDNFMHLQRTLTELEEQISASRRSFNAAVNDYNTAIQSFPSSLLANSFGFKPRDFFATEAGARVAPNLSDQF